MVLSAFGIMKTPRIPNILTLNKLAPELKSMTKLVSDGTRVAIYPDRGALAKTFSRLYHIHPRIKAYWKFNTPQSWHIRSGPHYPPILLIPDVGWRIAVDANDAVSQMKKYRGISGYDPEKVPEMKGCFLLRGPKINQDYTQDALRIVDVFNIWCQIMDMVCPSNNGSLPTIENMFEDGLQTRITTLKIIETTTTDASTTSRETKTTQTSTSIQTTTTFIEATTKSNIEDIDSLNETFGQATNETELITLEPKKHTQKAKVPDQIEDPDRMQNMSLIEIMELVQVSKDQNETIGSFVANLTYPIDQDSETLFQGGQNETMEIDDEGNRNTSERYVFTQFKEIIKIISLGPNKSEEIDVDTNGSLEIDSLNQTISDEVSNGSVFDTAQNVSFGLATSPGKEQLEVLELMNVTTVETGEINLISNTATLIEAFNETARTKMSQNNNVTDEDLGTGEEDGISYSGETHPVATNLSMEATDVSVGAGNMESERTSSDHGNMEEDESSGSESSLGQGSIVGLLVDDVDNNSSWGQSAINATNATTDFEATSVSNQTVNKETNSKSNTEEGTRPDLTVEFQDLLNVSAGFFVNSASNDTDTGNVTSGNENTAALNTDNFPGLNLTEECPCISNEFMEPVGPGLIPKTRKIYLVIEPFWIRFINEAPLAKTLPPFQTVYLYDAPSTGKYVALGPMTKNRAIRILKLLKRKGKTTGFQPVFQIKWDCIRCLSE